MVPLGGTGVPVRPREIVTYRLPSRPSVMRLAVESVRTLGMYFLSRRRTSWILCDLSEGCGFSAMRSTLPMATPSRRTGAPVLTPSTSGRYVNRRYFGPRTPAPVM